MDDRSVASTTADRVGGLPGSLLGIAPLRAAHEAGVVDLARPIETDVVELLMTGLNQFVVKAGAGLHRSPNTTNRRSFAGSRIMATIVRYGSWCIACPTARRCWSPRICTIFASSMNC